MTTESSLGPVQAAVFGVLSGDATLIALTDGIFEAVPEPNKYRKFVVVGATALETPDGDTFGKYGNDELLQIDVAVEDTQDRSGGKLARDIDARIVELLDGQSLTVAGRAFVFCNRDQAQLIHDAPWRHIARDFRIATEEP